MAPKLRSHKKLNTDTNTKTKTKTGDNEGKRPVTQPRVVLKRLSAEELEEYGIKVSLKEAFCLFDII